MIVSILPGKYIHAYCAYLDEHVRRLVISVEQDLPLDRTYSTIHYQFVNDDGYLCWFRGGDVSLKLCLSSPACPYCLSS